MTFCIQKIHMPKQPACPQEGIFVSDRHDCLNYYNKTFKNRSPYAEITSIVVSPRKFRFQMSHGMYSLIKHDKAELDFR